MYLFFFLTLVIVLRRQQIFETLEFQYPKASDMMQFMSHICSDMVILRLPTKLTGGIEINQRVKCTNDISNQRNMGIAITS